MGVRKIGLQDFSENWALAEFWALREKNEKLGSRFFGAVIMGVGVNFLIYSDNITKFSGITIFVLILSG